MDIYFKPSYTKGNLKSGKGVEKIMWRWIKQLATVLLTLTTFLAAGCTSKSTAAGQEEAIPMKKNPKILVAYYSQGGHTRAAAEDFKALTGGDIFRSNRQCRILKPMIPVLKCRWSRSKVKPGLH